VTTSGCPGCGFAGGRTACQDTFDDVCLRVRTLAWTDNLKTWRLMRDVYNVQHADDFCQTYDRLVTHLGGICWALEHGGRAQGYRTLQQLVDRNPWRHEIFPPLPGLPARRGTITVANLAHLAEPALLIAGADRWARATWLAYASLQPLARTWIDQAAGLSAPRR